MRMRNVVLITALGTVGFVALVGGLSANQPKADCTDAPAKVRDYKAPGQQLPLSVVVPLALETGGRPVQRHGWTNATAYPSSCLVSYRATIGNEVQQLTWEYRPATGQVTAWDDRTRRYSGW